MSETPKEKAFEKLGFGNLNILKLPSTTETFLISDIGKAIDIAIEETKAQNLLDAKIIDFAPEWEKIKKEHSRKVNRIAAFKELWKARSDLVLAELISGIERKERKQGGTEPQDSG